MANNDPLSTVSKVEQGLKGVNKQLDQAISKLSKINGLAGQSYKDMKGVISSGLGTGNSMNLGTSNASFSQARMPWMYSAKGAAAVGGAQIALGVAGAAYSGMPDMNLVMSRAGGYYNLAQRGVGTTRAGVAAATFSALRGGITGLGDDVAAGNILGMGFNYNPGGASYLKTMREVRGAAMGYNMSNPVAAMAIGGMHTGSMSGRLYQYGISTIDTKTGQTRSFEDIARQLYNRQTGGKKLTAAQLEFSMREGFMNQDFNNLGFSQEQRDLLQQAYTNFSQGKRFDLENEKGAGNPLLGAYKMNTSTTGLAERATEPYIAGLNTAAGALEKVNSALALMPDALFKMKAALDAFSGTNGGAAVKSLIGGVGAGIATIFGAKALRGFLGRGAASAATTAAGETVAGTAAMGATASAAAVAGVGAASAAAGFGMGKIGTKLGDLLGTSSGVTKGGSIAAASGIGAAIGTAILPGLGTVIGAGLGAMGGWLGSRDAKSPSPSGAPAPITKSKNATELSWASTFLTKIGAPVTEDNLAAMSTWMRWEGGGGGKATGIGKNSAMYNALNTTLKTAGSHGMSKANQRVQSYGSWDQGLDANVQTITNGRYSGILEKLKQGNDAAGVISAINASDWGTKIPGYAAVSSATGGSSTVNINLRIDKASDAEAIALAKRVKDILEKDKSITVAGSK